MERDLTFSAAPLLDLGRALGIGPADLAAVEGPDTLAHSFAVAAEAVAAFDPALARAFVEHYGARPRSRCARGS